MVGRFLLVALALFSMTPSAFAEDELSQLVASPEIDQDRDGLPDELEQQLLQKFVPVFFLSHGECDTMPAEFQPLSPDPKAIAKNGTIYGQVSPLVSKDKRSALIEIHYFHLWSQDCGRAGHALDAEHVSALVKADNLNSPITKWTAEYWYAGAHEDTVCDVSTGARASYLRAEDRGPSIWVSKGKHASFLSRNQCSLGCGGDSCIQMSGMSVAKLINLGERTAPLNGASWIHSKRWQLVLKMGNDFDDVVLAMLGNSKADEVIAFRRNLRSTQAVILAGDSTADALGVSGRKTGLALSTSGGNTERALDQSFMGVGESLNRTGASLATASEASGNAVIRSLSTSGTQTGRAIESSVNAVGSSLHKTAKGVGNFLRMNKPEVRRAQSTSDQK